jgi:hypothetical protein
MLLLKPDPKSRSNNRGSELTMPADRCLSLSLSESRGAMDAVNCDATVLNEVCRQRRSGWLVVVRDWNGMGESQR